MLMHAKSHSILHSIAEQYHRDAIDFAIRFDLLWEAGPLMHKMGRTKAFVDLMMGCECALKCDGLLTGLDKSPVEVYKRIRGCGHRIGDLLNHARYVRSLAPYKTLRDSLSDFPVDIRYSLDAYNAFFPLFIESEAVGLDYPNTIGNNAWVLGVGRLNNLMNPYPKSSSVKSTMNLKIFLRMSKR
jgi:hypothetical protein